MDTGINLVTLCREPIYDHHGIEYDDDVRNISQLEDVREGLDVIIEQAKSGLGLSGRDTLGLSSDEAEQLRTAIKNTFAWNDRFKTLIQVTRGLSAITPDASHIKIPWWNQLVYAFTRQVYNESTFRLDGQASHSYITQLIRGGYNAGVYVPSVAGVLVTADDKLVLGNRGGHHFSDKIMVVPAGSVQYHTGYNPVFESMHEELREELLLGPDKFSVIELLGTMSGGPISFQPHYVFRLRSELTSDDLLGHWENAVHRKEHRNLVVLPNNEPEVMSYLREGFSNGTVLPQCATAVAMHYGKTNLAE